MSNLNRARLIYAIFFTGFLTPKDDDFSETNNFNIEHVHFALRVRTNSR